MGSLNLQAQPNADFKVDKRASCSPLSVDFTNQSTGNIASYYWKLGNGNTSTQKSPQATYLKPGEYSVTLIVTGNTGQKDSITKHNLLSVFSNPEASFSVNEAKGCVPLSANFSDETKPGSAPISSFKWDFGDGKISTQKNPFHTYTQSGSYSVSLLVVDTNGCKDQAVKNDFIKVSQKPSVNFSTKDTAACNPPLDAKFKEKATSSTQGTLQYTWDFGDGNTSNKPNPIHTYNQKGSFDVELTVSDKNGCKRSLTKPDYVKTNKVLKGFKVNLGFSANQPEGCKTPFQVDFTASGNTSKIRSWKWNFGDGGEAYQQNPTHTYNRYGNFSVTLQITDQSGCKQQETKQGFVKIKKPSASFGVSKNEGCQPLSINFIDESTSIDPVDDYKWYFGDGKTQKGANPTHTYQDTGIYKPSLAITTQNGCKDSVQLNQIRVGTKLNPDFTVSDREGCLDHRVKFHNKTTYNPAKLDTFTWYFGDGSDPLDAVNPTHEYDGPPDSLPVTLRVSSYGCVDKETKKDFIILKPPYSDFEIASDSCIDNEVKFINNAIGADSFKWVFSDGQVSFKEEPVHVFNNQKKFSANLITWNDSNKCVDTGSKSYTPFRAWIEKRDGGGCAPKAVEVEAKANRAASFTWLFGNGDTVRGKKAKNVYQKPGTYDITMVAKSLVNDCVKKQKVENAVTIHATETNLSASKNKGCLPVQTAFYQEYKTSSSIKTEYLMPKSGTRIQNPADTVNYTYSQPPYNRGEPYTAHYYVEDSAGCISESSLDVFATKPRAKIEISKKPLCDSVLHTFQAPQKNIHGVYPMDYKWTFTPGNSFAKDNVKKTFGSDTSFQVKLSVQDSLGCRDTRVEQVNFEEKDLQASFTSDTTYGDCPPLEVKFKDQSSAGYTPIKDWHWKFGDESTSSNRNPQKLYFLPGEYDVTLTVTDKNGCKDSLRKEGFIVLDGPLGDYDLSPKKGCEPLEVQFNAQTQGASKVQWDMGDGSILNGNRVSYTYNRNTTYLPRLILSDSAGCTYAMPPGDTIVVKPKPRAGFLANGKCFGYPTLFQDTSKSQNHGIQQIQWLIEGDGEGVRQGEKVEQIFSRPGDYHVQQVVQSNNQCYDSIDKDIHIGGLDVNFKASDTTMCKGEWIQFFDETFADTTIEKWVWEFGDTSKSHQPNPKKSFEKKGQYNVGLTVKDVMGCEDSLFKPEFIGVGNYEIPNPPATYRATVQSRSQVLLEFGQYEDFDIERYLIYRSKGGGPFKLIDSIENRQDTFYIDDGLKTQSHSYCYKIRVESYCHQVSPMDSSESHCTIKLSANADTNRAILKWDAYKGWDNVSHYNLYRKQKDTIGPYSRIGRIPGDSTFYIDSSIVCYKKHWYKVEAVEKSGNGQVSWSNADDAKPVYIPNVPSNRILKATVVNNEYTKLKWTNPPNTGVYSYLVRRITSNASNNRKDTIISGGQQILMDSNVDVSNYSYQYQVRVMDSCNDIGDYSNAGKTMLLNVGLNEYLHPHLHWSPYKEWKNGVSHYRIQIFKNGEFQTIAKTENGEDTFFTDKVTNLNSLQEYRYRVQAVKNSDATVLSTSNEDFTTGDSRIFVPNAFSPNNDDHNDTFKPVAIYMDDYTMKVYNRWGERIFKTQSVKNGWDGKVKGKKASGGIYIYKINAAGLDGEPHQITGDVTLIR